MKCLFCQSDKGEIKIFTFTAGRVIELFIPPPHPDFTLTVCAWCFEDMAYEAGVILQRYTRRPK